MNYLQLITSYTASHTITEISDRYIVQRLTPAIEGMHFIIDRNNDKLYRLYNDKIVKEDCPNAFQGGWLGANDRIIKLHHETLEHLEFGTILRVWCTRKSWQEQKSNSRMTFDYLSVSHPLLQKYIMCQGIVDCRLLHNNRFERREDFPFLAEHAVIHEVGDPMIISRISSWSEEVYTDEDISKIVEIIN